jgi:hypothetical protein
MFLGSIYGRFGIKFSQSRMKDGLSLFTWPSGFGEELFKLDQSKTRIASGRHVGSGRN